MRRRGNLATPCLSRQTTRKNSDLACSCNYFNMILCARRAAPPRCAIGADGRVSTALFIEPWTDATARHGIGGCESPAHAIGNDGGAELFESCGGMRIDCAVSECAGSFKSDAENAGAERHPGTTAAIIGAGKRLRACHPSSIAGSIGGDRCSRDPRKASWRPSSSSSCNDFSLYSRTLYCSEK